MLTLPSSTRILLHRAPVDFRKAHDGLAAIVRAELKENPLSGDLFVFLNRGRNKVKLIHWGGNGSVVASRTIDSSRALGRS